MRHTRVVLAVLLVSLAARPPAFAQAPVIEYYHVDALGSVRAVTDASGTVVRTHNYHPFGEGVGVAPSGDPMGFTGKPRDGETGLDYFGARYYAQRTGRFTTVDPLMGTELALIDPQRWNRYTYSLNNPSRYVDPDGEMALLAQLAARFSPYADRAARLARQSYVWATRFFNSGTGQSAVESAAEVVTGAQLGPSASTAMGFAEGTARSAFVSERMQHASRHLTAAGILPNWSKATGESFVAMGSKVLENPQMTFDAVLSGNTAVKGFAGQLDGKTVVFFVYKSGGRAGQIATVFVPNADQMRRWGIPRK